MLKIHIRRAYIHVQHCRTSGQPVLDCCGEHGDLFFLLKFLFDTVQGDLDDLVHLLSELVELQATEAAPRALALSKRELATMA